MNRIFTRVTYSIARFLLLALLLFLTLNLFPQEKKPADTIRPADSIYKEPDEIYITATRIPERIIDIPYSIDKIVSKSYLFDRKIGLDDVLSEVPGLFLQSRYGDQDVRFSIRGFGSRSNLGVRGIRILLDDIPESEPDGQTMLEAIDFNSIGKIEIMKGNASSLYTNAPGGVINFINDLDFRRSSVVQFNQLGSFGLLRNGIKAEVKTDKYSYLTTYSYQNYDGYRQHNNEYWHVLNMVMEMTPFRNATLKILGYFVNGRIKLPGSLTKVEFETDPFQADKRSVEWDEKRITTKGRVGVRFDTRFGRSLNNDIEVTTYGNINFYEQTAKDYRITNKYGLGLTARYINRIKFGNRNNEFSIGGDLFTQPARTEYYNNISGTKGSIINQLTDEKMGNSGFYISEDFEILQQKLFVLLTGRYDHVIYKLTEETLPSRSDKRSFDAFAPKLALNYKLAPFVSLYISFGFSLDIPANSELDSPEPVYLYNHDLKSQNSKNLELGIKGSLAKEEDKLFLRKLLFDATLFNVIVDNEIVPYEVSGDIFYRNAAKTNRFGFELGARLEIFKDLDFTASYTFSDFKYDSYSARSIDADSTGNLITTDKNFSGHIVPSVPKNNLYLALSYSYPIIEQINMFAKVSYQGISGLWVDDANTDRTKSYDMLNSAVGFDMKVRHFNLMLSGGINNIFNQIYVGFTNTNSADQRFYEPGAPRNYYCSLNIGYTF